VIGARAQHQDLRHFAQQPRLQFAGAHGAAAPVLLAGRAHASTSRSTTPTT
jgi:hypothetical protein